MLPTIPQRAILHTVATLRRDAISIGVSTGVTSPLLARHIREQVAHCIGEEYAQLLQIVSEVAESREAPDAAANRADVWRGVWRARRCDCCVTVSVPRPRSWCAIC
jgi:siroheme synthase (precorrin-2 oxidase/ferrochelatase)